MKTKLFLTLFFIYAATVLAVDLLVEHGSRIQLECSNKSLEATWLKNGKLISYREPVLVLNNTKCRDEGYYICLQETGSVLHTIGVVTQVVVAESARNHVLSDYVTYLDCQANVLLALFLGLSFIFNLALGVVTWQNI